MIEKTQVFPEIWSLNINFTTDIALPLPLGLRLTNLLPLKNITHTKLDSSPVSRSKFETVSMPSVCMPKVNTFKFHFSCFTTCLMTSNELSSQNKMLGLVLFKMLTISSADSDGWNGTMGQAIQAAAKKVASKSSQFLAKKPIVWRGWIWPFLSRFCATRISRWRISVNVNWTSVSLLIWNGIETGFSIFFHEWFRKMSINLSNFWSMLRQGIQNELAEWGIRITTFDWFQTSPFFFHCIIFGHFDWLPIATKPKCRFSIEPKHRIRLSIQR